MYISNPGRKARRVMADQNYQTQNTQKNSFQAPTPLPTPSLPPTQNPIPFQPPQIPTETGQGYIIVRVSTASGAIPLEDALVTVTSHKAQDGSDILHAQKTDMSGLTKRLPLPAPPKSASLSPGNGKSYSSYNVRVDKDGYSSQLYINVPVFDGITAVQNADLVPLPENGETDRADPYNPGIFYENENPNLESQSTDN